MPNLLTLLDLAAILSSLAAAGLWYRAGARTIRRVSRFETLDHADLNRMIVAMNRSAILNRRAALASTAAAICFALRFTAVLVADITPGRGRRPDRCRTAPRGGPGDLNTGHERMIRARSA